MRFLKIHPREQLSIANRMVSNKKAGTVIATEKPLMILKQDKDSIYVRADTLYSGKIPDSLLTSVDSVGNITESHRTQSQRQQAPRYLQAFHHVRIFFRLLQAVCDSLYYSGLDSVFRLYTNPIAMGEWIPGHRGYHVPVYEKIKNRIIYMSLKMD